MVITVIVKVVMVDEILYKQNRCQKTFYEGETLKRAEILNKVMQKKKKKCRQLEKSKDRLCGSRPKYLKTLKGKCS